MAIAFNTPDESFDRRCDEIGRKDHRLALGLLAAGIVALGIWSATTTLEGVTRSNAVVVPAVQNQIVQHLEGGIVSKILVHEGDHVTLNQTLVVIKDLQSDAQLQQTDSQLQGKLATLARLDALLQGQDDVKFPDSVKDPALVANEMSLFKQVRSQQEQQKAALGEQVRQKEIELEGLKARLDSLNAERQISATRTASLKTLFDMGAVSQNEYLMAQLNLQSIDTRLADVNSSIPETSAALSESQKRQQQAVSEALADMSKEKSEALVDAAKLQQALVDLKDRAARAEVRAPIVGTVNKLYVQTEGGIVAPGAPIAEIVPSGDGVLMEARLSPADRAEIFPGVSAVVKVTAYDYSIYGGLDATVVDISPDALKEPDGQAYFRVRLKSTKTLGADHPIVPGMTANVDFLTRKYTILQYLLSPIINNGDVALRQ